MRREGLLNEWYITGHSSNSIFDASNTQLSEHTGNWSLGSVLTCYVALRQVTPSKKNEMLNWGAFFIAKLGVIACVLVPFDKCIE